MSNIVFARNDGIFEMLKWKNDAKISNDAALIYRQGGTMAYIKKKSERKYKITVCNGYKVNGQKRMKAQTITVPSSVPKRGIQQYVMAEAERIEKKFKYGVEESDQTHFEQYAENWLKRQEPFFKATTYAGYKRNLDIVYPLIGGIPLAKLLPMTLEEMCEELRKRPGRGGNCIKETTVQKYLETVSSVLEDAKKNDIIPFNPAHRVRKKHFEKEVQHIPQKYEIRKLMQAIRDEPILYRAYYTLAITTGLRRGELCALQWRDITGACELTVRRSRSCASGQIVESDTKSHRERIVTIPLGIWELLMALRQQQVLHSGVPDACGLKWCDINWRKRTIHVQRGVVKLSHQESITKDPKTSSGDRMVYLSKEMCQLLKAWRKECEWDREQTANETVSEDDYLFRQPNGKPMNPCTFTYRFKLILKANNLPLDLSVHSLRHTNASLLIAQGVDVRTVASLLGHAQASTTLDIYAHAFDKNKRKAQEKLGKAIGL